MFCFAQRTTQFAHGLTSIVYILIDRRILCVQSFNFTHLDVDHSRGFGIVSTRANWLSEAARLFLADRTQSKLQTEDRHVCRQPRERADGNFGQRNGEDPSGLHEGTGSAHPQREKRGEEGGGQGRRRSAAREGCQGRDERVVKKAVTEAVKEAIQDARAGVNGYSGKMTVSNELLTLSPFV